MHFSILAYILQEKLSQFYSDHYFSKCPVKLSNYSTDFVEVDDFFVPKFKECMT